MPRDLIFDGPVPWLSWSPVLRPRVCYPLIAMMPPPVQLNVHVHRHIHVHSDGSQAAQVTQHASPTAPYRPGGAQTVLEHTTQRAIESRQSRRPDHNHTGTHADDPFARMPSFNPRPAVPPYHSMDPGADWMTDAPARRPTQARLEGSRTNQQSDLSSYDIRSEWSDIPSSRRHGSDGTIRPESSVSQSSRSHRSSHTSRREPSVAPTSRSHRSDRTARAESAASHSTRRHRPSDTTRPESYVTYSDSSYFPIDTISVAPSTSQASKRHRSHVSSSLHHVSYPDAGEPQPRPSKRHR